MAALWASRVDSHSRTTPLRAWLAAAKPHGHPGAGNFSGIVGFSAQFAEISRSERLIPTNNSLIPVSNGFIPRNLRCTPGSETLPLRSGDLPPRSGHFPPESGHFPPESGDLPPRSGDLPPRSGDLPPEEWGGISRNKWHVPTGTHRNPGRCCVTASRYCCPKL